MISAGGRLQWAVRCFLYGAGIICMLLMYGLWQERIMAYPYDGEYFNGSTFLVLYNRLFGVAFAATMTIIMAEDTTCTAPVWKYTLISVTAVGASICQYEALKYVCFTVQMLGKSCKMLPVMLWGITISGKRYVYVDWITALFITAGVAEFLLTGRIASDNSQGTSVRGLMLLVAFVVLDGFTSTFQERLFRQHLTSKYNQMLYINLISAVITALSLLVSGFTSESFSFLVRHPAIIGDASLLSAAAVLAQWFIFSLVQEYGALVFAATMNLRQVVSILASYLAYNHPVTGWQILGLVIVGATLFARSAIGFLAEQAEDTPVLRARTSESLTWSPKTSIVKRVRSGCCPSWGP
mmetsp:Transcript_9127/g.26981  ORF Transcript_9127/g.26981 Transcript_9127/m.26981 type:complete len:353 (+) Transcript_9127:78-1136(+)